MKQQYRYHYLWSTTFTYLNRIIKQLKFIWSIKLSLVYRSYKSYLYIWSNFIYNVSNIPFETPHHSRLLRVPWISRNSPNKTYEQIWSLASKRQRGARIFVLFARCEGNRYSHMPLLPSASATVRKKKNHNSYLSSFLLHPSLLFLISPLICSSSQSL